jgi:hypothetical protein
MFQIVNPIEIENWDEQIYGLSGSSFFHGRAWAKVLAQSYGYRPVYFTEKEGCLAAVIPMMEVSSFLTGKRAVSLPFTDYCEPLVPHVEVSKVLLEAIIQEGRRRQWRYIELRGGADFLGDGPASTWFYRHVLDLMPGEATLYKSLRDSTRRNIKKAEKEGVTVRFETTLEALRDFYRLNCLTRREHGLPPQPWHFFANLHEEILSKGKGAVALAAFRGHSIAANVYLHSNGEAIYKYGASDKAWQNLRAANLVMWEAIKHYSGEGFRSLCFGRTEPGNEGLRQFKSGWGTEESILNYYRYDLAADAFVPGPKTVSARANHVFSRMPIPALRAIGGLLYRHMG